MSLDFKWVTPMSTGGDRNISKDVVFAKKTKSGRKTDSGEYLYQLGLTIPERLMKDARFVVGDRVEVGFAKDSVGRLAVAVRRVLSGGYTISSTGGGKHEIAKGKSVRGKIQMTFRDGMPDSFYSKDGDYEIDSSGMLIVWEDK